MSIRHLFTAVSAFITLTLISCQKEGVDLYEGNYSFKTSGILSIDKKSDELGESGTIEEKHTTESFALNPESGQMSILKKSNSSAIITMNVIGGDVFVFEAEITDSNLRLVPQKQKISFKDGVQTVTLDCNVMGEAEKLDNVVIFTLKYTGSGTSSLHEYTILDSDVKCVAKSNK